MEEASRRGQMSQIEAKKAVEKIDTKEFTMQIKANDKGVLFASVGRDQIAELVGLSPDAIQLEHPIKELGNHEIVAKLGELKAKFKLRLLSKES